MTDNNNVEIINSLRNGVNSNIPYSIRGAGRENEISEINRCLSMVQKGSGSFKVICGEFGSGKSYLLKVAAEQALRSNFIVSNVTINKGFRLNNIEDLYYNVMHNLSIQKKFKSEKITFEDVFQIWLDKIRNYPDKSLAQNEIISIISKLEKYNHSFARAFLIYIKARISNDKETSRIVASWLMGEQNMPAHVKAKFDIKGNIDKQNSLDFLKAFIKLTEFIGFSGMLITIDELGLVLNERSDIRRRSYENLRLLLDSCIQGDLGQCMLIFASNNEIIDDHLRGFYSYYALCQRLGNLDRGKSSFADYRQTVMFISPLTRPELLKICGEITDLHKSVYQWGPKISIEGVNNWVLYSLCKGNINGYKANTREYIVKLIEILDTMEQNPKFNIYNSELKILNRGGKDTFVNSMIK